MGVPEVCRHLQQHHTSAEKLSDVTYMQINVILNVLKEYHTKCFCM
jgi:hypothetical protein